MAPAFCFARCESPGQQSSAVNARPERTTRPAAAGSGDSNVCSSFVGSGKCHAVDDLLGRATRRQHTRRMLHFIFPACGSPCSLAPIPTQCVRPMIRSSDQSAAAPSPLFATGAAGARVGNGRCGRWRCRRRRRWRGGGGEASCELASAPLFDPAARRARRTAGAHAARLSAAAPQRTRRPCTEAGRRRAAHSPRPRRPVSAGSCLGRALFGLKVACRRTQERRVRSTAHTRFGGVRSVIVPVSA